MKRRYVTASLGALALGCFSLAAPAIAEASPVGYWLKEDGAAKLQISECGSGQLCSKIVWLRTPNDSHGQPLHDARDENVALRGRPIIGLPIFEGLTSAGDNSWKGQIYNPEDGGTYKATLTQVSQDQIILKGCLAMFLCGQKTWTRTEFTPPQPAAPAAPKEIEAKTPPKPPAPQPKQEAAAAPKPAAPRTIEASAAPEPSALPSVHALDDAHTLRPALPADATMAASFGYVQQRTSPQPEQQAYAAPKPRTMERASTERASPVSASVTRTAYTTPYNPAVAASSHSAAAGQDTGSLPATASAGAVPLPEQRPSEIDVYAEAEQLATSQQPLTWRERRRLRKLERQLPWLQGYAASASAQAYATATPTQAYPAAAPSQGYPTATPPAQVEAASAGTPVAAATPTQ